MNRLHIGILSLVLLCLSFNPKLNAKTIDYSNNCESLDEVVATLFQDNQIDDLELKRAFLNLYDNLDISECGKYIDALNLSGYYYYSANNLLAAKRNLFRADSLLRQTDFVQAKAQNQLFLGLVYLLEENYDASILCFNRCQDYAEKSGDQLKAIDAKMNLGLVYLEKNELDKAESIYLETLQFLESNNEHDLLLGYVYLNLARVYLKNSEFDNSFKYCKKAEDTWLAINHLKGLSFSNHLIYEILNLSGEIEEGIPHLLRSLDLIEKSGFEIKKAEMYYNLGEAYQSINDQENSIHYYNLALDRGYELPNPKFLEAVQLLGRHYFAKGDKIEYENFQDDLKNVLSKKIEEEAIEDGKNLLNEETIDTLHVITNKLESNNEKIKKQQKNQLLTFGVLGLISLAILWSIYRISEYRNKLLKKIKIQYESLETMNKKLVKSTNEIQEKNRLYELKNEELKRFAYMASHDLKSPLRTMVSFITLLKHKIDDKLEQNHRNYFKIIENSGKSMAALIDDLLSYSNIEHSSLNLIEIDSKILIDEVLDTVSKDVEAYNAIIEVDRSNLPIIKADKIKLQQVFQNIIVNAIKHSSPDRAPHIKVSSSETETHFLFHIKDNGEGIDPVHLFEIFGMFKKFSRKGNTDSSGIGLAICKKAIEMHKGKIWVENNETHGCMFSFSIPK